MKITYKKCTIRVLKKFFLDFFSSFLDMLSTFIHLEIASIVNENKALQKIIREINKPC